MNGYCLVSAIVSDGIWKIVAVPKLVVDHKTVYCVLTVLAKECDRTSWSGLLLLFHGNVLKM